jgi:hypothetical protein
MRKLLTLLTTQNPRRVRQGSAGGWQEARGWTRRHAKDPHNLNVPRKFLQGHVLRIIGVLCITLALACGPAFAQGGMGPGPGTVHSTGGGGFTPSCSQSSAFLARTSGLDTTHKTAYDTLICGLVTDALWSSLDALYIFATADATTAGLNQPARVSTRGTIRLPNRYMPGSPVRVSRHRQFDRERSIRRRVEFYSPGAGSRCWRSRLDVRRWCSPSRLVATQTDDALGLAAQVSKQKDRPKAVSCSGRLDS